ncbi:Eco57I restriction-modification methylase domain-containing protein [Rothia nasimurium]|uniref:Eco57I restriction-modification methylase domain-containing protein n=1 Tax=Rothia nasimurium TaxID=85336 RepID=UPI003BA1B42E
MFQLMWYLQEFTDVDIKSNLTDNFHVPETQDLYQTAARKLIYVQSVDNSSGELGFFEGTRKVGETSVSQHDLEKDWSPNSDFLRSQAASRINSYMRTSGLPYNLEWAELAYISSTNTWFNDRDVHKVLTNSGYKRAENLSGKEWFKVDFIAAKEAIVAVKNGQDSLDSKYKAPSTPEQVTVGEITLRPSQLDALNKTKRVFKTKKKDMLWNAKMRFGKTLTTLQLIKDLGFKKVLLMTHRPVVKDSWFEDFSKMKMEEAGYSYGSVRKGKSLEELKAGDTPFIYFASIQYLRHSGGETNLKNFADIDWDFIVIDEAHEGTQTELSEHVMKEIRKESTKVLELSGTPFNLLSKYEDDQIYTWDYTMEQEAKLRFSLENPDQPNPYGALPRVNMFTFQMEKQEGYLDDRGSFNFREFFRVDENNQFIHQSDVSAFLDNISGRKNKNSNYPFAREEFRQRLRHTLWLLPGVKEAKALEDLLVGHPVFGKEYNIVNVVNNKDGDNGGEATHDDLEKVRSAIGADPSQSKSITLTVRKLTTGVNVPEWTGVVFLSNTSSPTSYLQAAFRAQTPFSDPVLGPKEECYVFDFAPDRALTVMAEAAQINSGVGKKNTQEQRDSMAQLLNFMPILSHEGHDMKSFNVDQMLTQLKKVYAEKAVRSGFEDDSLYNDELLTLTSDDASLFNHVKAIVGTTKTERSANVTISDNGLTDEEYDTGQRAQKKKPRERTQEEKDALEKIKAAQKQRKAMISILRGVSIRIPMMIYGMPVDLSEDITIDGFVKSVDDESWTEFMPKGFTKAMFRQITKYYDSEVFIEAGKIIRRKAKSFDQLDLVERAEKVAELFGTFKNPDKETVLTPWRVVNLQLIKTLGGLSFYDEDFKYTSSGGVYQSNWVSQAGITDKVYQPGIRFLDINAKTGLYPLHVAMSLYHQALSQNDGGRFAPVEVYQRILKEQIFAIAKTPMAATITQRTLAGYRSLETNIVYIKGFDQDLQANLNAGLEKVEKAFKSVKFDVVVGNPPYQKDAAGDSSKQDPIYHRFMELSYKLANKVALITPARFLFNAGGTPKDFNQKMLEDQHLKVIYYEQDSSKVFPSTDIKGGVVVTYRDKDIVSGPIGTFISSQELTSIANKVAPLLNTPLSTIISGRGVYQLSNMAHQDFPEIERLQSKGHKNDIGTSAFKVLKDTVLHEEKPTDGHKYIQLLGLDEKKRAYRWIREDYVSAPASLNKYKVILPKSNGSGAIGEVLSTPSSGPPSSGPPSSGPPSSGSPKLLFQSVNLKLNWKPITV